MKTLSKEDILAVADLKTEAVPVPEWGEDVQVIVRTMTGADRDAFEQSLVNVDAEGKRTPALENMKAKLVAITVVDEAGNRMFAADEVGHLAGKSAAAINRIFSAAARLNGIGPAAEVAAAKNSEPAPSGPSTSA